MTMFFPNKYLMKFESFLILEKLTGKYFLIYHRSKTENPLGFKAGYTVAGGAYHGAGLYATQDISQQLAEAESHQFMIDTYGKHIIEFRIPNSGKFLYLDSKKAKKLFGKSSDSDEDWSIITQLRRIVGEKFEKIYKKHKQKIDDLNRQCIMIDTSLPQQNEEKNLLKFNAPIANQLVRIPGILAALDGIIYTGSNDGNCFLVYNMELARPNRWAVADIDVIKESQIVWQNYKDYKTEKTIKCEVREDKNGRSGVFFDEIKMNRYVKLSNPAKKEVITTKSIGKYEIGTKTFTSQFGTTEFPNETDVIAITPDLAKKLGVKSGDSIVVRWSGLQKNTDKLKNQLDFSNLSEFVTGMNLIDCIKDKDKDDQSQENYKKLLTIDYKYVLRNLSIDFIDEADGKNNAKYLEQYFSDMPSKLIDFGVPSDLKLFIDMLNIASKYFTNKNLFENYKVRLTVIKKTAVEMSTKTIDILKLLNKFGWKKENFVLNFVSEKEVNATFDLGMKSTDTSQEIAPGMREISKQYLDFGIDPKHFAEFLDIGEFFNSIRNKEDADSMSEEKKLELWKYIQKNPEKTERIIDFLIFRTYSSDIYKDIFRILENNNFSDSFKAKIISLLERQLTEWFPTATGPTQVQRLCMFLIYNQEFNNVELVNSMLKKFLSVSRVDREKWVGFWAIFSKNFESVFDNESASSLIDKGYSKDFIDKLFTRGLKFDSLADETKQIVLSLCKEFTFNVIEYYDRGDDLLNDMCRELFSVESQSLSRNISKIIQSKPGEFTEEKITEYAYYIISQSTQESSPTTIAMFLKKLNILEESSPNTSHVDNFSESKIDKFIQIGESIVTAQKQMANPEIGEIALDVYTKCLYHIPQLCLSFYATNKVVKSLLKSKKLRSDLIAKVEEYRTKSLPKLKSLRRSDLVRDSILRVNEIDKKLSRNQNFQKLLNKLNLSKDFEYQKNFNDLLSVSNLKGIKKWQTSTTSLRNIFEEYIKTGKVQNLVGTEKYDIEKNTGIDVEGKSIDEVIDLFSVHLLKLVGRSSNYVYKFADYISNLFT